MSACSCFLQTSSCTNFQYIRRDKPYASIIWNPWLCKDISALDSVQRKCEKLCTDKISFEPLS